MNINWDEFRNLLVFDGLFTPSENAGAAIAIASVTVNNNVFLIMIFELVNAYAS